MSEETIDVCLDLCLIEDETLCPQKCHMPLEVMIKLQAMVGSFVNITCRNQSFICSVWCKQNQEPKLLKINKCVQMLKTCTLEQQNNVITDSHVSHSIKLLRTEKASSITVKIIIDEIENLVKIRKLLKLSRDVHNVVLELLLRLCVAAGCEVDCKRLRYASLNGISTVVVLDVKSEAESVDTDAYIVDKNTDVIIESVQSKEWFEQVNQVSNGLKIGGMNSVVNMLADLIRLPLQHKNQFQSLGIDPPRGILLQGPPGCGKTSVVRYVARICETFLISVNGPEIYGPHPGDTESNLRNIFKKATLMSEEGPCILFIDEIDSVSPRKSASGGVQESRVTGQLLTLLDGLNADSGVIVIAATNRPGALDPAVRRPGRLDREVIELLALDKMLFSTKKY